MTQRYPRHPNIEIRQPIDSDAWRMMVWSEEPHPGPTPDHALRYSCEEFDIHLTDFIAPQVYGPAE